MATPARTAQPTEARLPTVVLRLYVAGGAPRSAWAIHNVRHLCEEHLAGRYELSIVDIYQQPELALAADLVAAPTLIKELPLPLMRFIGTLDDVARLLVHLDVLPVEQPR
jgi:circadian clock protein KaiB